MRQGVQIDDQYIGTVEVGPSGIYRAHSSIVGMSSLHKSYIEGVRKLEDVANKCGITGTLRTPEHRMKINND